MRFEAVNVDATVWLNGEELGHHRGAYLPFELAANVRPGENELVVRVDSRGRPGDLQPSNRPRGWWNYGGILREVYLRPVVQLDISELLTRPVSDDELLVRATLSNLDGHARRASVSVRVRAATRKADWSRRSKTGPAGK